ncbi:MAG: hypothetical protein JZU65_07210 [Chlorobium sp.]|nr:hypothetical protein [Chlorobium sp.]
MLALRDKAEAEGKYGPAIAAEISRGKAAGLYSSKIELSTVPQRPVEDMTRAELMVIAAGKV